MDDLNLDVSKVDITKLPNTNKQYQELLTNLENITLEDLKELYKELLLNTLNLKKIKNSYMS